VNILNRNGTVLYQLKGQLPAGNNLIWNGKINEHSVDEGTYFYKITLHYLEDTNKNIAPISKEYVGFFNVAF
jgi:hypothetical protein